jgi:hypothetical protein
MKYAEGPTRGPANPRSSASLAQRRAAMTPAELPNPVTAVRTFFLPGKDSSPRLRSRRGFVRRP